MATSTANSAAKGKRKRVSRACDQCFLKKDRCDGLQPLCTFCSQLGRTCTYDRPERKRGPTQGLRPRLEQRIIALETVLGLILSQQESSGRNWDVDELKSSNESSRRDWREAWLQSRLRMELDDCGLGLGDDLGFQTPTTTTTTSSGGKKEIAKQESPHDEATESDYSEVDLSLPPTHHPPPPLSPTSTQHPSSPHSQFHTIMPELSSGKGGSSLNRGLVPRGADPNAALGGFEIQFGGNDQDEDWVRRFVPPHSRERSASRDGDQSAERRSAGETSQR